ncbi:MULTISPECIES: alpha/beta hydrolase [Niastella]|uniref:Alpha/beta hydrolase n=1 Tax=Niastella soli TaxID=2821487 RepID=A0ABS3YSX8_9BACT|nr:alpha/beta hydrolase [Niastella soli]MBO9200893.1 alpha/beta hydrolase [Niastella soli]
MRRLLFLSLIFLVIACKKENNDNSNAEKTAIDVSYGNDAKQKMDVYLPANRDTVNTKLLILIHGGAWIEGDKSDFIIDDIKKLLPGYALANVNYRLSNNGQNTFPAQEEDISAAVAFLLNKQIEYKFSKKIVLLGASAGAHLALLQGYKHADLITPRAIISYFGPTDLAYLYNHPGNPLVASMLAGIIGATPLQNAAIYATSSPINYVSGKSPPTLLLQGDADPLVPVAQANMLKDKLVAFGVNNQLVIYPGEQHGFTPAKMLDSYTRIVAFLQANVP